MSKHTGNVKRMATLTAPNRTIVAVLFLVGGALQILGAVLGFTNVGNSGGFYLLSNLVLGAGFVLMFLWFATTMIAHVAYVVAAAGWLLLAVTGLLNLGILGTLVVFIAVVGSVLAGVVVFTAHVFGREADILFLAAMIAAALNLLVSQNSNVPGLLKAIIVVVFGVLLVLSSLAILGLRLSKSGRSREARSE
jgi:hypothetical protein